MKLSQDTCFDGCTVLQIVLKIPHKTHGFCAVFFTLILIGCFLLLLLCIAFPSDSLSGLFTFLCAPSLSGGIFAFQQNNRMRGNP